MGRGFHNRNPCFNRPLLFPVYKKDRVEIVLKTYHLRWKALVGLESSIIDHQKSLIVGEVLLIKNWEVMVLAWFICWHVG